MSEQLWAPWRIGFILGPKDPGCFMCEADAADESRDAELLVLERTARSFVIMNKYPYSAGHILIVPRAHEADLCALDDVTVQEIAGLTRTWVGVLRKAMQPQGFNVGWNFGVAGGAGVADHVHEHVVPRWIGDVNFMSACADIRVVNQSLESAWALLRETRRASP